MTATGLGGLGTALAGRRKLPRRRLVRLLHRLALLAVLAAIAHLAAVLLIPRYATQDAASQFISAGAEGTADLLRADAAGRSPILDADPATALAVCGFDLDDGAVRVSQRVGQTPLSLSIHLRGGGVVYSVTDRAAQRGVLEFVIVNLAQYEERLAAEDDSDSQRELRVIVPANQGIVVARALVRQPSDRANAEALVAAMACGGAG
jgi:uncharacterized membrane protein